jgi:hypothetical protein
MYDQATAAPPELEEIRCPSCGGLNRVGAQWCGQCLERFVPPKPLEIPGRSAESGPPPPPPPPGGRSATIPFSVGADGISWACKQCETVNPFDTEVCSACGTSFAELLRPPAPVKPERDPNKVALISLFWPGAGHGYLGQWGQAIARGVISFWVLLVTIVSLVQGGVGAMSTIFGVISFGLWLVAAHDSFQEASNASSKVILKQKYFLWIVLGLLVLLMVMITMQGLQASAVSR